MICRRRRARRRMLQRHLLRCGQLLRRLRLYHQRCLLCGDQSVYNRYVDNEFMKALFTACSRLLRVRLLM